MNPVHLRDLWIVLVMLSDHQCLRGAHAHYFMEAVMSRGKREDLFGWARGWQVSRVLGDELGLFSSKQPTLVPSKI